MPESNFLTDRSITDAVHVAESERRSGLASAGFMLVCRLDVVTVGVVVCRESVTSFGVGALWSVLVPCCELGLLYSAQEGELPGVPQV